MNIEKIVENLNTEYLGKNLIYYAELESTQKLAKKLVKENVVEGTTIVTDYQTNGIGTHDRKWHSCREKDILFTFILYPKCNIEKLSNLTFEIAKEIVEVVDDLYKIKLDIKKPNDLILNGKKVGGILTETKIIGEQVQELMIGIGINVHRKKMDNEILKIATFLEENSDNDLSREIIISEILNRFEKQYNKEIKEKE